MKEREFYCVKCKKRVVLPACDINVIIYKNKKSGKTPALTGFHSKCGTKLTKFIKRDPEYVKKMIDKYGIC